MDTHLPPFHRNNLASHQHSAIVPTVTVWWNPRSLVFLSVLGFSRPPNATLYRLHKLLVSRGGLPVLELGAINDGLFARVGGIRNISICVLPFFSSRAPKVLIDFSSNAHTPKDDGSYTSFQSASFLENQGEVISALTVTSIEYPRYLHILLSHEGIHVRPELVGC